MLQNLVKLTKLAPRFPLSRSIAGSVRCRRINSFCCLFGHREQPIPYVWQEQSSNGWKSACKTQIRTSVYGSIECARTTRWQLFVTSKKTVPKECKHNQPPKDNTESMFCAIFYLPITCVRPGPSCPESETAQWCNVLYLVQRLHLGWLTSITRLLSTWFSWSKFQQNKWNDCSRESRLLSVSCVTTALTDYKLCSSLSPHS